MQQDEPKLPVSEWRLEKVRRYIAERIPLVPKDQKICVDEKALDGLLPQALSETATWWDRVKDFFHRAWCGAGARPLLEPAQKKQLKKHLLDDFNRAAGDLPFPAEELDQEAPKTRRTLVMAGPEELTFGDDEEEKMSVFRKWFCVRHALVKAGAHLEVLPPSARGGIREVYTRDRYVMIGDTAYLPDPDKLQSLNDEGKLDTPENDIESYKGEIAQIHEALHKRGVTTITVKDAWFEGGNVLRHTSSRTIFVGIDPPWFSEHSAERLIETINKTQAKPWQLVKVPLTNAEEMYHLDTGMSEELPHGEVMISPLVTDKKTFEKIRAVVGGENIIRLSDAEARNLATNMIDVGDTLVMTGTCEKLKRRLTARGYKVIQPRDYGQKTFEFGLGGVHCMTNDIKPLVRKNQGPRNG